MSEPQEAAEFSRRVSSASPPLPETPLSDPPSLGEVAAPILLRCAARVMERKLLVSSVQDGSYAPAKPSD